MRSIPNITILIVKMMINHFNLGYPIFSDKTDKVRNS